MIAIFVKKIDPASSRICRARICTASIARGVVVIAPVLLRCSISLGLKRLAPKCIVGIRCQAISRVLLSAIWVGYSINTPHGIVSGINVYGADGSDVNWVSETRPRLSRTVAVVLDGLGD